MRSYFVRVPGWARNIYPKAIWSSPLLIDEDCIHLTIDDGPHPESTPLWLELLAKTETRVIFFLIGQRCEHYPSLVEEIKSAGHIIGSHGYAHLDGWRTSTSDYVADAKKSCEILNTDLFRPAYGRMTRSQYRAISDFSKIIMWSLMPGEFDQNTSPDKVAHRLTKADEEDLIVLHDEPGCFHRASMGIQQYLQGSVSINRNVYKR